MLPDPVRRLFWEIDPAAIDLVQHRDYKHPVRPRLNASRPIRRPSALTDLCESPLQKARLRIKI